MDSKEYKKEYKKVFVWGTFDCLHQGHKEFLLRAKQLGELYVIIIPSHIKYINSGYFPLKSEFKRKNELIQFGKVKIKNLIENVFIDCFTYGLKTLLTIQPDIFCFGYDQTKIWDKLLIQYLNYFSINPTIVTLPTNGNGIHSSQIHSYKILRKKSSNGLIVIQSR